MKKVQGVIDSINFSSENFEELFIGDDFIIQPIKGVGVFEPKIWRSYFGKMTPKSVIDAKILHTSKELALALKRFSRNPNMQTIEFAGLYAYTQKSEFARELLLNTLPSLQSAFITRVDIAVDFKSCVPAWVKKFILRSRRAFVCKNTTYFKSKKEKKSNTQMDIKIYNKSKKEGLAQGIERLEFCFKGQYFSKMTMRDIDKITLKMQKSIKRMSGLDVSIESIKISL